MKKKFSLTQYLSKHWIRLLSCFIYGLLIVILYNGIRKEWSSLLFYVNGLFIGGITLVLFGLLVLTTNFGAFDIFSFMFNNHKLENGRSESFYDYTVRKKIKRKATNFLFIDYEIIGIIYIIASFIASSYLS